MISVIVPVYNVEEYILDCLRSISKQSYKDFELILVDDCGSDDSMAVAEEFLQETSILWKTIRHQKNLGLAAARNSGIAAASGEYLYFLDSDDWLSPSCLEKLSSLAVQSKADITVGRVVMVDSVEGEKVYPTAVHMEHVQQTAVDALMNRTLFVMAWNKLIRREFYFTTRVSFHEGVIHEDDVWSFELTLHNPSIAYLDDCTYFYRQRGGSIMGHRGQSLSSLQGAAEAVKSMQFNHKNNMCYNNAYFWCSYVDRILIILDGMRSCHDASTLHKLRLYRILLTPIYVPKRVNLISGNKLYSFIGVVSRVVPVSWAVLFCYFAFRLVGRNLKWGHQN